jgi:hypothetical protein
MAKSTFNIVTGPTGIASIYHGDTFLALSEDGFHEGDYLFAIRGKVPSNANQFTSESLTAPSKSMVHLHAYKDLVSAS